MIHRSKRLDWATGATANLLSMPFWATCALLFIVARETWNVEMRGLAMFTPAWFMPGGFLVAAAGIVVTLGLIIGGQHAPMRLLALALWAFSPIFFVLVLAMTSTYEGTNATAYTTVCGVVFAVTPWIMAAVQWHQHRRDHAR